MIRVEVLDYISHGEVKGEGVHLLRIDTALRGRYNCVYCCACEAQVSRCHFLKRCSSRRLWEMFRDWTVSGISRFFMATQKILFILVSKYFSHCAHITHNTQYISATLLLHLLKL